MWPWYHADDERRARKEPRLLEKPGTTIIIRGWVVRGGVCVVCSASCVVRRVCVVVKEDVAHVGLVVMATGQRPLNCRTRSSTVSPGGGGLSALMAVISNRSGLLGRHTSSATCSTPKGQQEEESASCLAS